MSSTARRGVAVRLEGLQRHYGAVHALAGMVLNVGCGMKADIIGCVCFAQRARNRVFGTCFEYGG